MKQNLIIISLLIVSTLTINAQWNGTSPIWTNSNVGIGTSNPTSALEVSGTIKASANILTNWSVSPILYGSNVNDGWLILEGTSGTKTSSGIHLLYEGPGQLLIGKIGVSGGAMVSIGQANKITDSYGNLFIKTIDAQGVNKGGQITFGGTLRNDGTGGSGWAAIAGRKEDSEENHYAGYLQLSTQAYPEGINTERMRITSTGNVGIGTSSPQYKLDVNGALNIASNQPLRLGGIWGMSSNGTTTTIGSTSSVNLSFDAGNTSRMYIQASSGNVGIGTTNPQNLLDVNGTVHAREFKASLDGWSDYVFDADYQLPQLKEVENYIKINKHLKDIPSTEEVEKNGVNIGELNAKMLKKIEELTLYIISQNYELERQTKEIQELKSKIKNILYTSDN